jgi:hypothetical protein
LTEDVNGRRLAWADQALHWGAAARRMLTKPEGFIETQLAFVAVSVALGNAVRLVDGRGDAVPGDVIAQADCPIPHRELRRTADRLAGFRDEILHLHDKVGGGRHVTLSYTSDPPGLTLSSTVGRTEVRHDSLNRDEAVALLTGLEPWLRRHQKRLSAIRDAGEG